MGAKVTIKDVAELAGVSKSTVSRYLNHGYISLEKQQRVREAIEQTGFKSNFFAKRLKTQESKLIGIVLPRMDSVTVGKLLSGINRIFDPAGYQGILLVSHLSIEKELENIQNLQQQGVDGILVDSVGLTDRHIELAKTTSVPIVYTGQWNEAVPSIKIDDWAAGRMVGSGNGLRRNPLMRRLAEALFGLPLSIPAHREEAAYGAALCALVACGRKPSMDAAQRLIRYENDVPFPERGAKN